MIYWKKSISILILILFFSSMFPFGDLTDNNLPVNTRSSYLKIHNNNLADTEQGSFPIVSRGNEPVTFENVSIQANISQYSGNYFAWADYNNDGYQDLLVNGKRLLKNNGPPNWDFTDITNAANISYSDSINVGTWGDWNNDGYMDFYAAGGGWTTSNPTTYDVLWRNTGPPNYIFEDYTIIAGNVRDSYPSTASGWGDFDNDGNLDLYVANYENENYAGWPDTLWHNNGNGTFTDVSTSSGIRSVTSHPGRGVAWCDYNNDGWNDIYISNYRIVSNFLFENQRDGTFINVASEKNCQGLEHYYQSQGPYYGHTIGSSWADYDNNGLMDLMVANLVHKYVGGSDIRGYICDDSNLYHNYGYPDFNFTDNRLAAGIPTKPICGSSVYLGDELYSGITWGDYDNDGDLDFWVPQVYGDLNYAYSYLYRNNNDGTFTDVASSLGIRVWNTYGSAWCDFNNDGFLDMVTGGKSPFVSGTGGSYEIHLFKNNGNSNNWLKVQLIGTTSNHAAIGARVYVETGQLTQMRQVEGGMGSHGQQNGFVLHFGLNSTTNSINKLTVIWPNGNGQAFNNLPVNQQIDIIENTTGPKINTISVSDNDVNEDEIIVFDGSATDPNGAITKYEWDFNGDNIFDWSSTTTAQTNHGFNTSGNHYAKLRVWDDSGSLFTEKVTEFITVNNLPPTAIASSDVIGWAWEDQVISLNGDLSTDTPSDLIDLEFNWTFSDGSFSGWNTSTKYQHFFTTRGDHDAVLTVRDNNNVTDTDTIQITIRNKPPSCMIVGDNAAPEDSKLLFSVIGNDTPSDLDTLRYQWDFGDGAQSDWLIETEIEHTYKQNGSYILRCSVRDDEGNLDQNLSELALLIYNMAPKGFVEEDVTVNEDEVLRLNGWGTDTISDRSTLSYLWDFGDGTTSDWLTEGDQNISHVYTKKGIYKTKLIIEDNDGAQTIKILNVTVENVPPTCEILDEEIKVNVGIIIDFDGMGIDTVSDLDLLQYSWDFAVPSVPNTPWNYTPAFEYLYRVEGKFTAVLTVRDDDGETASADVSVSILNIKPEARFSVSESKVKEDENIIFDASDTVDSASDMVSLKYRWDFADGSATESEQLIQYHSFYQEGDYSVELTVTDDDGEFDIYKKKISITNMKPIAIIEYSTLTPIVGEKITFIGINSSDTPSDKINLTYFWEFGDRSDATAPVVTHEYNEVGNYKVILTCTDDDGASNEAEIRISVIDPSSGGTSGENGDAKKNVTENTVNLALALVVILIIILLLIILFYFKVQPGSEKNQQEGPYIEKDNAQTIDRTVPKQELVNVQKLYGTDIVIDRENSGTKEPHLTERSSTLPLTDDLGTLPGQIGEIPKLLPKNTETNEVAKTTEDNEATKELEEIKNITEPVGDEQTLTTNENGQTDYEGQKKSITESEKR